MARSWPTYDRGTCCGPLGSNPPEPGTFIDGGPPAMYPATEPRQAEENTLAKRLIFHWQRQFDSAAVVSAPFEHFYTDQVWPADVYDQLLRLLPPGDVYEPLNIKEWVNAKGVSTRDKCYLPEIIRRMEPEHATFWRQVWLALTAESLKRLIFRKFKNDIALRLGAHDTDVEETDVSVHISLARDIEDYRIKPHPDGWPAIVTAQFYLPADMTQNDLGTSFYIERSLLRRLLLGRYQEIKRMQFVPNSGYFFAVNDLPSRRSLHGREQIRSGAGVRNSILLRWSAPSSSRKRGHEGISPTHQLF
jgi:hypothetical protein